MSAQVETVPFDEAEPWYRAIWMTLLADPHDPDLARRVELRQPAWEPERTWGVRDHGRWVATLATQARTLTVPGGGTTTSDLEVDALTAVTVAATHRRRGLLTRMLSASLPAAKERGDALSILIAAEWPIYGRYGYAPATVEVGYDYHPRRSGARVEPVQAGRVRQVEPDELGEIAPALYDLARRQHPGQVDRPDQWWNRRLGINGHPSPAAEKYNWFVHDGADGPDGLLAWKVKRDFDLAGPLGALKVPEFVATNDEAYLDLWAYLGGIDVVDEITLSARPLDEPIRWRLQDGRALVLRDHVDFLWVRLLDVAAALSARRYAVPGRVVLDVVDDDIGGYGAGRYALDAGTGAAACAPTSEAADLRISQRALASIYLGGHRLRERAVVGDFEELTPGAVDRVDLMFSTPVRAWNATGF
jgi:predicted acetyltransferase